MSFTHNEVLEGLSKLGFNKEAAHEILELTASLRKGAEQIGQETTEQVKFPEPRGRVR